MKRASVLAAILTLILVGSTDAVAQKKGKSAAAPIQREFDLSVSRLPANFKGDNGRIGDICESLPEELEKSDFETDADFERRKTEAFSRLRSYAFSNVEKPSTEGEKVTATMYPDPYRKGPWIRYDINKSTFQINLKAMEVSDIRTFKKGSYVGQTAFGVKKTVQKADGWRYYGRVKLDLYLELPVPVEVAKLIKDDLRVLAVVKPAAARYEGRFHRATIDAPLDITWHEYTLVSDQPRERYASSEYLTALDVWIYNYKTGEILCKRNDELKKAAAAKEQAEKEAEEREKKYRSVEEEWRGVLYLAEESLKQGMVKEAKERLNRVPQTTNAWKVIGSELMKQVEEKERQQ